jgi:hypothetical protein
MLTEYRPLWWRPWLEPPAPVPQNAEPPDVTGFQLPEALEPVELATRAEPPPSAE